MNSRRARCGASRRCRRDGVGMTVAYPWVLWSAVAAAVGVFVSHLLSVRRPPLFMLPTTRFLPPRTVRAVSLSARPTDVLLLLLRMLAVLCAGVAFAGVYWSGGRKPVVTVIAIDAAATTDDSLAWRTAIDRALQDSPSAAVVLSDGQLISGSVGAQTMVPGTDSVVISPSLDGSLASALLAARRAAPAIARQGDSIALLLVSPLRQDVSTAVLDTVRAMWPGRITLIPVLVQGADVGGAPPEVAVSASTGQAGGAAAAALSASTGQAGAAAAAALSDAPRAWPAEDATRPSRVVVRSAAEDDVVSAAFARWPITSTASTRFVRDSATADAVRNSEADEVIRIARDSVTSDDEDFANAGGVLVVWADAQGNADTSPLPAVIANGRALVSRGMLPIAAATAPEPRTIVWWPDGSAAATERDLGAGCVREVLFTAPTNDALLQTSARGVLSALSAPCGVAGSMGTRLALNEAQLARLRGDGPLARADAFNPPTPENRYARWLLLAALMCLIAESLLRRRSTVAVA